MTNPNNHTLSSIRKLYLDFYAQNGHAIIPSSALVPENDPTTLFTGSGMQPMITYLLGEKHPKGTRIADSQKCFRSQDIEEVGDNRHQTFFEMLGNWSLGDYFKKEQLPWVFEFLTKKVGLAPDKIFVTVFRGNAKIGIGRDDDSVKIWQEIFAKVGIDAKAVDMAEVNGMADGRIFYYDEKKNWWSRAGVPANMPVGEPGGPDSELFYDFGAELKLHENSEFKNEPCHVNCDCGRFMEIGNSVFMQFQKANDGTFPELKQKNVDFGGGLERILAVSMNTSDVFITPAFRPIIEYLEKKTGQKYDKDAKTKQAFRVIADHVKASVMLAADGVYPSSKEQGYFARRLVRRAIRYGKMIGINDLFIADLVPIVVEMYQDHYTDLVKNQAKITEILQVEEKKFAKTIANGLREIDKQNKLDAQIAFKLYETHGFPFELTQEIAKEKGQDISKEEFEKEKQAHADKSRSASAGKFKGGLQDSSEQTTKYHTATHLLHAALRKILGTHVQQKGSNITAERLRFDFSHTDALTDSQKQEVEAQINAWIKASLPVTVKSMQKQEALKSGAIAFFIEKYPDQVTVYTIGNDPETDWISKEFCGGPHVKNTSEIGEVKVVKEKAISAGVRRIYLE